MEVDVDGSFSYAEPQTDAKASGKSSILFLLILVDGNLHLFIFITECHGFVC